MFELDRHLKQSGLANKAHVPWDGGVANTAGAPVMDVIRRLVHEIHVITHEAHKVEGMHPRPQKASLLKLQYMFAWLLSLNSACKTFLLSAGKTCHQCFQILNSQCGVLV